MENQIALFMGGSSLSSAAIQLGTRCPIVHAAASVNGRWYHASEQLKFFGLLDRDVYRDRMAAVYDLPDGAGDTWLDEMTGVAYDWPGVLLWITSHPGHSGKMYCFEAVKRKLSLHGITVPEHPVSGCHIHDALTRAGIAPAFGKFGIIT